MLLAAQDAFFMARRPRKDSPHTTAAYRRDLGGVTSLLALSSGRSVAELTIGDVTAPALRAAFGEFADGHAKTSVARAWSTWNQFMTFCVADGFVEGNPMGAVTRPKAPPSSPKPLRGEDTPERLLAAAAAGARKARDPWPERDVLVIALGLVCGLRSAEVRALRRDSVVGRPGEQRLHVRGKGSRERSIPIESPLERLIGAYLGSCESRFPNRRLGSGTPLLLDHRGQPIGRGALDYLVKTTYLWAGIRDQVPTGANLHALRHTFATRLAEDGANAAEIMALLGHANLNTSQNYIEATGKEQRAAAAGNRTYRALSSLDSDSPAVPG
ncbi:tyrosine-type recombinase/integrase [Actinocrispum wychmicini]|uniref:Site-specific recombinase XerD n=1 Tax=Actinocrispum wychmicini TaxID=1213861 RepID=A0A4R2JPN6_9PSEU|nr:tyrosine-type recombinase/integrase [Actinocrispum wychmicini]TCO60947.1 site-specific recombinase XerD [Actinocrispum wychmicini]